jgi:chorismate mutase / prephenate dehydratase
MTAREDGHAVDVWLLGPAGTFTERVAHDYFGEQARYHLSADVADVCRAVQGQVRDRSPRYGVLAVENNVGGFVADVLDAIADNSHLQVHDEVYLSVHQHLISHAASVRDITVIKSHPQAFLQIQKWLRRHRAEPGGERPVWQLQTVNSTAGAVLEAVENPSMAAIGSAAAAERYRVPILARNIEDHKNNATRFWIVTSDRTGPQPSGDDKTAFLIHPAHQPGTLHTLLGAFALKGINLLWLQARPIWLRTGGSWEYQFFLEVAGHMEEANLRAAYEQIRRGRTRLLREGRAPRVLGSYPSRSAAPLLTS